MRSMDPINSTMYDSTVWDPMNEYHSIPQRVIEDHNYNIGPQPPLYPFDGYSYNDHNILPPSTPYLNHNQDLNNNYNGMNGTNIMPSIDQSDANTSSSPSHSSISLKEPLIMNHRAYNENFMKMSHMMQEMKQNMDQMLVMTNLNNMKHMKSMMDQCKNDFECYLQKSNKTANNIETPPIITAVATIPIDDNINRKRGYNEYMETNDDENENENENEDHYPEVGVRATTTIKISKELFIGNNALHFEIATEILYAAIQRICEYRWIHSKYNIKKDDVEYLVFLNHDLDIPLEFKEAKPKRGRPPKHKKRKLNTDNQNMAQNNAEIGNDKIYRFNFQIIFKHYIDERMKHEMIECIKIDLNNNSLSLLLSNVLAVHIECIEKVDSYSLFAVDSDKLKEYERYERDEDERKKKKREREQKRREENKKKELIKL